VNRNDKKKHRRSKRKLKKRLQHIQGYKRETPMMTASTVHYEIGEKSQATPSGGIGAMHMLAVKTGLREALDETTELLKIHQPYHESDHILNMAYNILAGGQHLEDIDQNRRKDPAYMDGLGAERIPASTTERDFLRRFEESDVVRLMETINRKRQEIWRTQSKAFKKCAVLNIDSTMCPTSGECKEGMGMSRTGEWGYDAQLVSLGNSREPLYIENRPGNTYSGVRGTHWINCGIDLCRGIFEEIWLRGDTAYPDTKAFDTWDKEGVTFVFGYKAHKCLVRTADAITRWKKLKRPIKRITKTEPRTRPENIKEQIVIEREYYNEHLEKEEVAEFMYRPGNCTQAYRMIVLRKTIQVTKGQLELFDDYRYFFYITNSEELSVPEVVYFINERCDHENDIEQLKNGVKALRMSSDGLVSNWAYAVIASLAWTLKAWTGLLMPHRATGKKIIRMEFKRFHDSFIHIPAQIINRSGQLWYRLLGYMEQAPAFFGFVERCQCLKLPGG
jgi:hypothetical protein